MNAMRWVNCRPSKIIARWEEKINKNVAAAEKEQAQKKFVRKVVKTQKPADSLQLELV